MEKAKVLRRLIEETGLSVKAFSEKAEIPYTTLRSMLERGLDKTSVGNAIKVCRALNITVEELECMSSEENLNHGTVRESGGAYSTDNKPTRQDRKIETIAAHLEDKDLSDKKIELLKQYIDALFDEN